MLRKLALVALAGVAILSAASADAQFYEPNDRPPPGYGYDRPRYGDDRPRYGYDRPRYGYDRPYGGRRLGDTCVTSRGSCETNPAPRNAPCRCFIEGFGPKRGNIY